MGSQALAGEAGTTGPLSVQNMGLYSPGGLLDSVVRKVLETLDLPLKEEEGLSRLRNDLTMAFWVRPQLLL